MHTHPPQVKVSGHPLVLHKVTQLRDRRTEPPLFRALVSELSQLLFYEATADLMTQPCQVETPLAPHEGRQISERIALIPILRAGLGMAEPLLELMPTARVWHLGLYRDHETCTPVTYYNNLPPKPAIDISLVLDPMLATGGSAVAAIELLREWGANRIRFIGLIAAPEGVQALREAHPEVPIHLAALDSHLNEKKYIVPGLGDAGDRLFGT